MWIGGCWRRAGAENPRESFLGGQRVQGGWVLGAPGGAELGQKRARRWSSGMHEPDPSCSWSGLAGAGSCPAGRAQHNPKECSQGGPGTGFHPNPGERSHPKGCWQQGTVPTAGKAAPEEQLKCLETRNPSGCWTSPTRLKLPAGWGQDPSLIQKQLARGAGDPKVSNHVLRAVPSGAASNANLPFLGQTQQDARPRACAITR